MKQPKLTYQEAQKRLEEIVREIESNEHDIDRLCDQLKEANCLLQRKTLQGRRRSKNHS